MQVPLGIFQRKSPLPKRRTAADPDVHGGVCRVGGIVEEESVGGGEGGTRRRCYRGECGGTGGVGETEEEYRIRIARALARKDSKQ